jgi:hypothetical protein
MVFSLLIYAHWGYRKLRSRADTLDNEIWRFIGSFMVAFVIINVLWFFATLRFPYSGLFYSTMVATVLAIAAFFSETLLSMMIYRLRYGNTRVESAATEPEIKRFIIIFVAVFTIINAVWIDMWAIGWFS